MRRTSPLLTALSIVSLGLLSAGTVSYYETSLPTTMNPLFATTMVDRRTHELVFDRLFYRSAVTGEIKSRLVDAIEVLDDGLRVRLSLRSGVRWHDGEHFTGRDVCFTVDTMLDPKTPSLVAKAYQEVLAGCEASRGEVTITFTRKYYNPRERLEFPILPRHMFGEGGVVPDHEFSARPIGTGPMKGSKGRREVRLTAVENVHHRPQIDVMALGEGGDPLIAIKTLTNGGVHGVISVAPPLRSEVAATDDVALKSYDLRSWWFVAINSRKGALTDLRVRQALDHTLDREELRRLTMGYDAYDIHQPCQFISGPFVPSSPYYNRSIKPLTRSDLAHAKELMESAGARMEGGNWTLRGNPLILKIGMHAPLDLEARDLLNQIGNQLQAGGFGRQVHKISPEDWNERAITGQMGDFDLLIGKWSFGVVEDIAPMFEARRGGKGTRNLFNYDNEEVNRLLARYDMAKTDTEAQDAYHELHKVLAEDLPYLFLWKLDTKSAWRMEVRNNTITPFYYFTEFDGWELRLGAG